MPALLVVGDRDVFVPTDHAVALHRQLPDGRLCIVPDCDHQVMASRPAIFNQVAETFYRTTGDGARARAEGGPEPSRRGLPPATAHRSRPRWATMASDASGLTDARHSRIAPDHVRRQP
jgi:hypothetical protein